MKKIKIILVSFLIMFVSGMTNVSALNQIDCSSNEESSYYEQNGNYYNPETGEYFCWNNTNSRTVSKEFTFKIRYSVKSNSFKLKAKTAKVKIYKANFEWQSGKKASCCSKHRFTVNLRRNGLTYNTATFYAPISSTKSVDLGGGFSTSDFYVVEITNNNELPYGVYLVGSGAIVS